VYLPAEPKCGRSKCMNTEEAASKLVALCREQKWLEAINSLQFDVDVTDKASGKRAKVSELGIYTVKDGKIVREEFLPHSESEG
jgi:hypothetical protein